MKLLFLALISMRVATAELVELPEKPKGGLYAWRGKLNTALSLKSGGVSIVIELPGGDDLFIKDHLE